MTGPRIGALFAGYGGLEMATRAVLGGEIGWHSECEPPTKSNPKPSQAAARILAHRFPGVPNHGDITAIDWTQVEPVDVLTGGFPCQDVSAAGKRAGIAPGTRSGLWSEMHRAIVALQPSLVVIENVRGLLSADAHHPAHDNGGLHGHERWTDDAAAHGDMEPCPWCVGNGPGLPLRALGAVLGDLADIGYDARWTGLRAADVGAPHGRFRVFVAAWPAADAGGEVGLVGTGLRTDEPRGLRGARPDHSGVAAAHASRYGRHEGWTEPAGVVGGSDAALGGDAAADAHGDALREQSVTISRRSGSPVAGLAGTETDADPASTGRGRESRTDLECDRPQPAHTGAPGGVALDWGTFEPAVRRWERCLGRPAPSPTEPGSKGQPRLSPAFVEWLMGLPAGWVTDVPGLGRNEQLKALGNGVVPQQAAAALRLLLPDFLEAAA